MTGGCPDDGRRTFRRPATLLVAAAATAAIDLAAKAWAREALPSSGVQAGPLDLRLSFNPGVAFSVGAAAPAGLVVAVTALITVAVAVFAWRVVPDGRRARMIALAAVLGGAVGNLADRVADGVVTDYLQTGWWPTFNHADTAIVIGAALLVLDAARPFGAARTPSPDSPAGRPAAAHTAVVPGRLDDQSPSRQVTARPSGAARQDGNAGGASTQGWHRGDVGSPPA